LSRLLLKNIFSFVFSLFFAHFKANCVKIFFNKNVCKQSSKKTFLRKNKKRETNSHFFEHFLSKTTNRFMSLERLGMQSTFVERIPENQQFFT